MRPPSSRTAPGSGSRGRKRARAGLRYCLSAEFRSGGLRRLLAITCEEDPRDLFGAAAARNFAAIGAMLSLQLSAPDREAEDNSAVFGAGFVALTALEKRILVSMAEGRGLLEIAREIGAALPLLRRILHDICRKLQVGTHADALAMARARGLVAM
ncbi:helix-turn-helix transcriptional regulator [Mangrovicoccus ximenensis]|uniref:helix-turn-helix transcriptional regulator n=1 Tax=Mangrovicoccus ximenensis TaxID=1911570 RepID=UPI001F304FA3|nr:helix-turn-helix transcriptional regulator [Mangrovicoccus ximenensis]